MRPTESGPWRKDGRRPKHREYPVQQQPTRRQREAALVAEAGEIAAHAAWLSRPEASALPGMLAGMPGVHVVILGEVDS